MLSDGLSDSHKDLQKYFDHYLYPVVVFLTGACVLIIEVIATRILSPYFGNTIFTVSSILGVVLAALSIGYYYGGRLADRRPDPKLFFKIIFVSGVMVLLMEVLVFTLLPALGVVLPLTIGPLVASALLFMPPAFFLGMLSPFAIKLQEGKQPDQGIGSIAGEIFFFSTIGSIVGSFSAGFLLVPFFGITSIMIGVSAALMLLGGLPLVHFWRKEGNHYPFFQFLMFAFIAVSTVPLLLGGGAIVIAGEGGEIQYARDGVYERLVIIDGDFNGQAARFLRQDRSSSGAMFPGSPELVYAYTKYYELYELFDTSIERTLSIGGGAYSVPKALFKKHPEAQIDVAEVEPSLFSLAKEYFEVPDDPRFSNYVEDGRRFLRESEGDYDLIFSDVYYSLFSIPSHFTTKEFFELSKEKLSDDGVFIGNFIGNLSREKPSFLLSEMRTFMGVFPYTYFIAVESPLVPYTQNIMFVGSREEANFSEERLEGLEGEIFRGLHSRLIDPSRFHLEEYPVLTDDFAPVEYLVGAFLDTSFSSSRVLLSGEEMLLWIERQLTLGPRVPGTEAHKTLQDILISEMTALGAEVVKQSFVHETQDGRTVPLNNIVARFNPELDTRIVLGTHYDTKQYADEDWLNPNGEVPGANDSASGVAVLMELARMLSLGGGARVGMDVVFFDGEEGDPEAGSHEGWFPIGSTYFAENIRDLYPNTLPRHAIVIDMVCERDARFLKEGGSITGALDITERLWEIGQESYGEFFVQEMRSEVRDDHTPLNAINIPSALIIDFEYPHWHTTRDTIDKCAPGPLEAVADVLYEHIETL